MNRDLVVGIDVGTTSTKAILSDRSGAVLGEASHEYATTYPHPNWAEQDPDDWWRAACRVLRQIFAESTNNPARVAAVAVSCQAPSLVAVDSAGRPLFPALIWMDRRSEAQCTWLREEVGEEMIARINGGRIDPYYLAPKLLWLRKHAPDAYQRTHAILQANGYLVHKLCASFTMDMSHGPLTLLFDSEKLCWSETLLDAMGLDPAKLPPIVACTDLVGAVTPEAATVTGLVAGTPVLAGMTDGTAAAVEAGLAHPGDAAEMTGQSTVLLICSDKPYLGRDLIPLGHPIPGRYLVAGALVASGGALRWFRDQLGEVEQQTADEMGADVYDLLSARAALSPPGANRLIFLPYLYGERSPIWDSNARGVFFGLSLATQKDDLIRAIMEGAAFGLRHNIDCAAEDGFKLTNLACVGGGARSALWNQIKADVLQHPVHLPQAATGAPMGDAIVAAAAVGLYDDVAAAMNAMIAPGVTYRPDTTTAASYNALYQIYVSLYPQLRTAYQELANAPVRTTTAVMSEA